jgi:hypothetical protein
MKSGLIFESKEDTSLTILEKLDFLMPWRSAVTNWKFSMA